MFDKKERRTKKAINKYEKTMEMSVEKKKAKLMKFSVEELKLVEAFLLEQKAITEKEIVSHKATIEKVQNDERMDKTARNLSTLFAEQYLEVYEKNLVSINQELAIIDEIKKALINAPEKEI